MRPVLTIVASVIAAVVVLWLILLVCFAILRPPGATLRDAMRILPDAIRLVHRLARDHDLSRGVRVRLFLLLGYLAFPIDLVPDFVPVLGYADDAIVIGIVLRSVIRRAGPDIVRNHWPGSDDGLALLAQLCRIPTLRPDHTPRPRSSPGANSDEHRWGHSDLTRSTVGCGTDSSVDNARRQARG